MKRRRRRRNPTSDRSLKGLAWTVGVAALTAAAGALAIWYVNKKLQPAQQQPALDVSVKGTWANTWGNLFYPQQQRT